jgi:glutathione S-transferase
MSLKLYYSPGACSLASHIVLEESGLPYTTVLASTKTHKLADGTDYYTINPLGYVPVLEFSNGVRMREGTVIMQYIADQVLYKHLAPANGTMERYRLQEWLSYISTELHKSFAPLFAPNTPDEVKAAARERLLGRFRWLDGELKGKSYIMGDHFSVADAYLFTVSRWTGFVGVDVSGLANFKAVCDTIAKRPAVQAALKAEGLPT